MDADIIVLAIGFVVLIAGLRIAYVIRKSNKAAEERHRLAMERLDQMRRELDERRKEEARKAKAQLLAPRTQTKVVERERTYVPSRRPMVDTDDDGLATMIMMNNVIQNNTPPVYVDSSPSYSYSSSSDDSCSRSSYESSSSSSSYSSYSSSDSGSSYSSSDSGSSSSGCD